MTSFVCKKIHNSFFGFHWIINTHLFVANTDTKSQNNISEKYNLTVTGWYQIMRSSVNLKFPNRTKFPLTCHNFPFPEISLQVRNGILQQAVSKHLRCIAVESAERW